MANKYPRSLSYMPIEKEADVPLGVQFSARVSNVVDVHCIYLTWDGVTRFEDPKRLNDPDINLISKTGSHIGDYCVVFHRGDELNGKGYYRGQIKDIKGFFCQVHLIDIGTVIQLSKGDLFMMPDEYLTQRRLAVRFGLKSVDATGDPALALRAKTWLNVILGANETVTALVTYTNTLENKSSGTKLWGHLYDTNKKSASDCLQIEGIATARAEKEKFKDSKLYQSAVPKHEVSKIRRLFRHQNFKARILPGAKTMSRFFIIKEAEESVLMTIEQLMKREASLSLMPYLPWVLGNCHLCAIEKNEKWCRGRVLNIDINLDANVRLLDTGEDQNVPLKELKVMPNSVKEIPALAYVCELPIRSETGEWDESAMSRFYQLNDLDAENGLVVWVLDIVGCVSVIDFKLLSEGTTWCTALEAVQEASLQCKPEIALKMELEVSGDRQLKLMRKSEGLESNQKSWSKNRTEGSGQESKLYSLEDEDSKGVDPSQIMTSSMKLETNVMKQEEYPEFHYERLMKLKPLNDMKGKVFLFNRVIGFNILTLLEKTVAAEQYQELQRAIKEFVTTDDAGFKPNEVPALHQVVLAPFTKDTYQRAKVEEVRSVTDSSVAFVRFLEHGIVVRFPVTELKKANIKIMNIPVLVYIVKLDEVEDDIPILESDFTALRIELQRSVVLGCEVSNSHRELPTVILYTEDDESRKSLSTVINNLAVWQWQKLFRVMYRTFLHMASQYEWPLFGLRKFMLEKPITEILKRSRFDLKIETVKVDGKTLYISGRPQDENVMYQARTVQTQMINYFRKIKSLEMSGEEVFACTDIFGVKLDEGCIWFDRLNRKDKEKFNTMCTWHRCYYYVTEDAVMCMDCCWQAQSESGLFRGFLIRQLTPDFYTACPLGITCKVDVSFVEMEFLETVVKSFFPKGKVVPVMLENRIPKWEHELLVYQAEIRGLKQIIMDQLMARREQGFHSQA